MKRPSLLILDDVLNGKIEYEDERFIVDVFELDNELNDCDEAKAKERKAKLESVLKQIITQVENIDSIESFIKTTDDITNSIKKKRRKKSEVIFDHKKINIAELITYLYMLYCQKLHDMYEAKKVDKQRIKSVNGYFLSCYTKANSEKVINEC